MPGITFAEYIETASRSAFLALPRGATPKSWAAERMRLHWTRHVFNVGLSGDRWLQVSKQRTADGGTVILQTDITDLIRMERSKRGKQLDDQARMIRATLEHINQGVSIFDANRRLVGWNSRVAQLFDIPMRLLRREPPSSCWQTASLMPSLSVMVFLTTHCVSGLMVGFRVGHYLLRSLTPPASSLMSSRKKCRDAASSCPLRM